MDYLNDIPTLHSAMIGFHISHGAALPPTTAAALIEVAGRVSIVDQTTGVVEALYAALDAISEPSAQTAAATLVGQLAAFSITMWQNLSMAEEPDRGARILAAMRRRLGETVGPDPSTDPLPLAQYAAA